MSSSYGGYMKKSIKLVQIGIRLTDEQKAKLDAMSEELQISVNAVIGELIDNATIEPVVKQAPVARLKKGGKSDAA
jgi:predicted DNA-binding protein